MLREFQSLKRWNRKVISIMILFTFFVTGVCDYKVNAQSQNEIKSLETASTVSLVSGGKAACIYVDQTAKDYNGLSLIAQSFTEDVNLVTGVTPEVVTDQAKLKGTAVIAGSIGNNKIIDSLITSGKIDVNDIKSKWECYKIQVVDKPVSGVDKAIVVVGSDKRGTIYGIYHISEMIGVSPWVYWGDTAPKKQKELTFSDSQLSITSKEPSVKYRGIFLNDEWPSLGNWVGKKFGGFNEKFYNEVYKLILRLKGNYLWPAMWSGTFSEDGKSSKIANAKLASDYGIVMGTSHHEPMCRAGVEWQNTYKNYGTSNVWDFNKNKDAITNFWDDGIKRNKDFDNLITLGMRGEADSALSGTLEDNINLLKNVITTQKGILSKYNVQDTPKVFTVYKEVEKFWNGDDKVQGLKTWDGLDDTTIMLADDNFGNLRNIPTASERNRKAGWGMYYHFDYHGGPRSYEWVNTIPISKVWEQMSMAYDYGIKNIWIVNVGDLKPMELPISYYMDLAYDFDKWGTNGINKTDEYTKQWTKQQFGAAVDDKSINDIAGILSDYTNMNGKRKPEVTANNTYSIANYNEAQRVLTEALNLESNAKKYYEKMPEAYKDAYYQLVYYPAVASANVKKMMIYSGLSQYYGSRFSALANTYGDLMNQCIKDDKQLQSFYNNTMSKGKWSGMMSSDHIGYKSWDSTGWAYPLAKTVTLKDGSEMIVEAQGGQAAYGTGTINLPDFTSTDKENYSITISNGGTKKFNYKITTSAKWIKLDNMKGSIETGKTINASVDWKKVKATSTGNITITSGKSSIIVNVSAKVINTKDLSKNTFVETHDVVSINAEHYVNTTSKSNVEWKTINNFGKYSAGVKMYPTTVSFTNASDAPYIEYSIYVDEDADYTLTSYTAPTNNFTKTARLKYAVAFDNETPVVADALQKDYVGGDSGAWNAAVTDVIHIATTKHKLTKGVHTLRFYGIDAGLVLEKLVLSNKALSFSYFGPQESYYVGK